MELENRLVAAGQRKSDESPGVDVKTNWPSCPRCGFGGTAELEKTDPEANTCYRCWLCKHVFSPKTEGE
jgi:rubredoxin